MLTSGQAHAPDSPIQAALSRILEGTASEIGEGFFRALVENLAAVLGTRGAWVTEFDPERRRLKGLAFWLNGQWVENWEQSVDGTPCQVVVDNRRLVHYPERIIDLYPNDPGLRGAGAVSYMGVPLMDLDGSVLGHLAVLDVQPMPDEPVRRALFEIFAGRAAAELRRIRVERQVRARQAQLAGLIESALDAIVQLDGELRVTGMNPAAERTFEIPAELAKGTPLSGLVSPADAARLETLCGELRGRSLQERSAWVRGGFTGLTVGGSTFPAEATLSLFELDGRQHFTLILRNVNDRLEAERRIATLTSETEYLRTELRDLGRSGEIIGTSAALLHVLSEVRQVAPADTTVLILGETGTGKELFARAIHEGSRRRGKPLVKVNCAAIPAALIESEFFGHERGAFTGATARRDGRFALADGGTHLPRRGGRAPPGAAGKAPARPAGGRVRAGGQLANAQGGRARRRRDQPRPAPGRVRGQVPRGPVLPAERLPAHASPAAGAGGGRAAAGGGVRPPVRHPHRGNGSPPSAPRPLRGSASTPGRATSASCRTSSSGR